MHVVVASAQQPRHRQSNGLRRKPKATEATSAISFWRDTILAVSHQLSAVSSMLIARKNMDKVCCLLSVDC